MHVSGAAPGDLPETARNGVCIMSIFINGKDLTIEEVIRVCRGGEEVRLTEEAKANVNKARAYIERKL